jgi:hypothetical protein
VFVTGRSVAGCGSQRVKVVFWFRWIFLNQSSWTFWPEMIHKLRAKKLNSMVWVSERTIPTERPPLVGEVIANFCG